MTDAQTMGQVDALERVRSFWDTEACGTHFVRHYADDRDFFAQYRDFRYRTEWHIPEFADFPAAAGKQVLEIGCGNGADGVMFARHGAHYTGVDLTAEAVAATRRHFAVAGVAGSFARQNCEQLEFADGSFDIAYSFGALHHTPSPWQAVRELHRVLKRGGVARVMLHHRRSFNYYARIQGYMRARALLGAALRLPMWRSDRRRAAAAALAGVRGNAAAEVWNLHYRNFLREGWSYFRARNFMHHCAAGPECPYAFAYTAREAKRLFAQFRWVYTTVAHLPLNKYPVGRMVPRGVERLLARHMGWHLLIWAVK